MKSILLSTILLGTMAFGAIQPADKVLLDKARKSVEKVSNDKILKEMYSQLSKMNDKQKYVKIEGNTFTFYSIEKEKELIEFKSKSPETQKMNLEQFVSYLNEKDKNAQINMFCRSPYDYSKLEKGITFKFVHKLDTGKDLGFTKVDINDCKTYIDKEKEMIKKMSNSQIIDQVLPALKQGINKQSDPLTKLTNVSKNKDTIVMELTVDKKKFNEMQIEITKKQKMDEKTFKSTLVKSFNQSQANTFCSNENTKMLLDRGISWNFKMKFDDKSVLGETLVNKSSCKK